MAKIIDVSETENISYSQFACIGSGFAAIGLGATLKRWYGIEDVKFFERHNQLGGTWFINRYPGMSGNPVLNKGLLSGIVYNGLTSSGVLAT